MDLPGSSRFYGIINESFEFFRGIFEVTFGVFFRHLEFYGFLDFSDVSFSESSKYSKFSDVLNFLWE